MPQKSQFDEEELAMVQAQPDVQDMIKSLRDDLDISQEALARLVGVSLRTVSRWELGTARPDSYMQQRLTGLHTVVKRLLSSRTPDDVIKWLQKPQRAICRPIDLLAVEGIDSLLQRA